MESLTPQAIRSRRFRERHPEHARKSGRRAHLKRRYGTTPEAYDALFVAQDGKCAVCHEEKKLDVDHDHASGEIRGLLCHRCNWGLGILGDDPERLMRAARYLTKDQHHERCGGPTMLCVEECPTNGWEWGPVF